MVTTTIGKLSDDDGTHEGNECFRYLLNNGINLATHKSKKECQSWMDVKKDHHSKSISYISKKGFEKMEG
jgi:type III secretory pathway lipoprotein EscJ